MTLLPQRKPRSKLPVSSKENCNTWGHQDQHSECQAPAPVNGQEAWAFGKTLASRHHNIHTITSPFPIVYLSCSSHQDTDSCFSFTVLFLLQHQAFLQFYLNKPVWLLQKPPVLSSHGTIYLYTLLDVTVPILYVSGWLMCLFSRRL